MKNTQEKIKPKLFSVMKTYTWSQFGKDVIAGIIVAIIALPLSIALALASGVEPEQGIYTAIIAGFLISFFGGSRVQIAGPTAAFATIVAGIVATDGMDGLIIATIIAGVILILMGLFRLGSLIKFIPYTSSSSAAFSTRFFGRRPALRSASVIIHCNCPLVERNSSAAHASMAFIVSLSTRKMKLLVVDVFLAITNNY